MVARALPVLEPLSIAGLFIFLLNLSWLRWADPLIDFPKDLYISWRVSEGDLLYEKITNWYGPLSHIVEAAAFRLFGVGTDTIVWLNISLLVVALLLLRAIFGTIGNRLSVWLGSLVFLVVFAFGHLSETANYNFIAPYASQATYSFLGLLLVLWGLLRHLRSGQSAWLALAGIGLAVAYLDKPEALLAAMGALAVYFTALTVREARAGHRWWSVKSVGWLAGGFMALALPVFLYFYSRGGAAYAWDAINRTVLSLLDEKVRSQVANEQLMLFFIGWDHPWENFLTHLEFGATLALLCGTMAGLAWWWCRLPGRGLTWWLLLLGVAGLAGVSIWVGERTDYWFKTGPAFGFPVLVATTGVLIGALVAVSRGRQDGSPSVGVAVVGVAASLMLARMILNVRLSQYGFFMMPLAVWFLIHLMTVEAPQWGARVALRRNWLLPMAFAAVVLSAVLTVLDVEIALYGKMTYTYGEGRDRAYTRAPLRTANGSRYTNGLMLNTMIQAFRLKSPHARNLVAFPEGIAANYHLRIPSTLAEAEFHPLALGYVGPEHVLAELRAQPPDAVVVFYRNLDEFGVRYFGESEASGSGLLQWVRGNYVLAGKAGQSRLTLSGHAVDIYVPKPPSRGPPLNFGPF